MRRAALSLAPVVAVLVALAPAMPASASTVVVSDTGLPSTMSVQDQAPPSCSGGVGSYAHVTGPGTPPLGTGSLRLQTGADPEGIQLSYGFPGGTTAADLTALSIAHNEPAAQGATPTFTIFLLAPDGKTDQLSFDPSGTGGSWQQVDLMTVDLSFFHDGVDQGDTTWAGYEAANSSATLEAAVTTAYSCSPAPTGVDIEYVDDWSVGLNGTTTTYDFEPPTATASITVSAATITAGRGVTVSGTVISHGVAVSSAPVQLWAKKYPASTYRKLTTLTSDSAGHVHVVEKPLVRTTYQWRLAQPGFSAARSATKTVSVRTKLTSTVPDKTLRAAQLFVMHGSTLPKRPGAQMSLMRVTSRGDVVVQRVKVARDGTYRFSHLLPKGTDKVFARIPAGTGDLAAQTAIVRVTVG